MKRFIVLPGLIALFILSGCLDTTEETTINDDGSGSVVSSLDMGKMLTMMNEMGGAGDKIKDDEKVEIDTVAYMKDMKDKLGKLSDDERKLLEKGTTHLQISYKEEKFLVAFSVPFSNPSEIAVINEALKKSKGDILGKIMDKVMPDEKKDGEEDDMEIMGGKDGSPDINNYYDFTYEKNKITKKLNKEKYAKVEDDESLKSLKETSQMGVAINFKTIFNLPRAAKKAEGKGVKLSDDKKKVTIEGTLDDFFEDGSYFNYEIEY
jgi:hypothetical protein